MIEETTIDVRLREVSRIGEVDFDNLPFGRVFTDHMLVMYYENGEWSRPIIKPFENLSLHPATSAIHYGQSIFEGLKAYRNDNDEVLLFRADENAKRLNMSARRMCMPEVPEDVFLSGLQELVRIDKEWIPKSEDSSLYIRPFMFSTDDYIGIKPSDNYVFSIFCCPVGAYYAEPLKVKIETKYTRAASGGVGEAKAAGNYAASLYPAKLAKEKGYHQLVWTDAETHTCIEEAGTMNIVFQIGNTLITPEEGGTILPGITKKSVLDIARSWGYTVEERRVTVAEIREACENGQLADAFGAGTAATIAQIQTIGFEDGVDFDLTPVDQRDFSNKVYDYINKLKRGTEKDTFGWTIRV